MEKSSSALDDGCTSSYHTVFIDTSLDTHLALIVSDSDTVSDLKSKYLHLFFPFSNYISFTVALLQYIFLMILYFFFFFNVSVYFDFYNYTCEYAVDGQLNLSGSIKIIIIIIHAHLNMFS